MIVSKIIDALLKIDESRGCNILRAYETMFGEIFGIDAICCVCEYSEPMPLSEFVSKIDGSVIYGNSVNHPIYGYTIIDSPKAIVELMPDQFQKIYGRSTARALIFTGVSSGKSPMVAIRVTNLKPGVVVLQGIDPSRVNPIAVKIAEVENIPLLTTLISAEEISTALNKR